MLPQIPVIPEVPQIPVIQQQGGGNKPDSFDPGTFNPNLLGQYVGYFNPNFPAAPSQLTPDLKDPFSTAYTGLDTIGQQDDEDQFGIANLLSLSPTFRFFTQAVPEIIGNVVDALTAKDKDPDGKPETTPDPAMDIKEQYATDTKKGDGPKDGPTGPGGTTSGPPGKEGPLR